MKFVYIASIFVALGIVGITVKNSLDAVRAMKKAPIPVIEEDYKPNGGPAKSNPDTDIRQLRAIRNPIFKEEVASSNMGGPSIDQVVSLSGVWLDIPCAHLKVKQSAVGQGVECTAFVGEPISYFDPASHSDKLIPELAGWTLKEVYSDKVLFVNGTQRKFIALERTELAGLSKTLPGGITQLQPGQGYNSKMFKSRLERVTPDSQEWGVDAAEAEWVRQNGEAISNQIDVSIYSGGGIKIDRLQDGSPFRERGLLVDDVIKSINGLPITSAEDAKAAMESVRQSGGSEVTVVINRLGKLLTLKYSLR